MKCVVCNETKGFPEFDNRCFSCEWEHTMKKIHSSRNETYDR